MPESKMILSHLWLEKVANWKYSKSQIAPEPSTLLKQAILETELKESWKTVMPMILVSTFLLIIHTYTDYDK